MIVDNFCENDYNEVVKIGLYLKILLIHQPS